MTTKLFIANAVHWIGRAMAWILIAGTATVWVIYLVVLLVADWRHMRWAALLSGLMGVLGIYIYNREKL